MKKFILLCVLFLTYSNAAFSLTCPSSIFCSPNEGCQNLSGKWQVTEISSNENGFLPFWLAGMGARNKEHLPNGYFGPLGLGCFYWGKSGSVTLMPTSFPFYKLTGSGWEMIKNGLVVRAHCTKSNFQCTFEGFNQLTRTSLLPNLIN